MKKPIYGIISFIAGVSVFIPALLILIIDGLKLPESNPLVAFAFPTVLLFTLPEGLIFALGFDPPFPIIVPLIALICGIVSMKRNEARAWAPKAGITLALIGVAVYGVMRVLFA